MQKDVLSGARIRSSRESLAMRTPQYFLNTSLRSEPSPDRSMELCQAASAGGECARESYLRNLAGLIVCASRCCVKLLIIASWVEER